MNLNGLPLGYDVRVTCAAFWDGSVTAWPAAFWDGSVELPEQGKKQRARLGPAETTDGMEEW
jgi:hypothetical protein